jgi:hypothetical protein
VFLITTASLPPALSILIKYCKNKDAGIEILAKRNGLFLEK